jgi:hypothetical protein
MGKKRSLAGRETLEQQKEQLSRCMSQLKLQFFALILFLLIIVLPSFFGNLHLTGRKQEIK